MTKAGNRILESAKQAVAIAKNEMDPLNYVVHVPDQINVKAIRKNLKMTQTVFANTFGFKIATLRHWEQKKRVPEGPARAYLLVISREPETVQKALSQG